MSIRQSPSTAPILLENFPSFDIDLVKSSAIERARSLIKQFDLHNETDKPVDIASLVDKFDVQFLADLPESTWGFTLDLGRKIIIAINEKLSAPLTRFVAMHEVGHVALWHPNQLHACLVSGQEAYDQLESDATAFAAIVAIPRLVLLNELVYGAATVEQLAEKLVVPPELVIIRQLIYSHYKY